MVPDGELQAVTDEITEGTSGQAAIEVGDVCYFAEIDGKIALFED